MPRFNYLNGLVLTPSLFSAQQHHFDCKVHDALIRKGTHKQFLSNLRRTWVGMVLSLPIQAPLILGVGVSPQITCSETLLSMWSQRAGWLGRAPCLANTTTIGYHSKPSIITILGPSLI
jgi:hypothetical protein